MFIDKGFVTAFLISALIHTTIAFPYPDFKLLHSSSKKNKVVVKYVKLQIPKNPQVKLEPLKREPLMKIPSRVVADIKVPLAVQISAPESGNGFKEGLPSIGSLGSAKVGRINKPNFTNNEAIKIKRKISLPALDLDKIDNPSYISYYHLVREKIKRSAYQSYFRTDTGNVYISFVISNDGSLMNIRLNEEKSCQNQYLKAIALRSINEASPFPSFPKEMDYPQLSFNVEISFEIEN